MKLPFLEKNAPEKIEKLNDNYLPNILIGGATDDSELSLMENRFNPDGSYIYVCVNGACKLPNT